MCVASVVLDTPPKSKRESSLARRKHVISPLNRIDDTYSISPSEHQKYLDQQAAHQREVQRLQAKLDPLQTTTSKNAALQAARRWQSLPIIPKHMESCCGRSSNKWTVSSFSLSLSLW
mmetsp:Transcript_25925/g.71388  ORF Transcript_25925/g.71388 Transcript_25925/m.71388 type:complete len:118 (-) Transcript_25925:152-505(-)